MQSLRARPWVALTVLGLLPLLAWDASGLDLVVAHWSGDQAGFALRNDWWLTTVLHDGARRLAWVLALLLCLGVWWPVGPLRRIEWGARLRLAASVLASVAVVALVKGSSGASCPWELADFGGVAHHVSHWTAFFGGDGGAGHCFPAGHASSGFAFVAGWFAFRHAAPGVARAWLAMALGAGLLLGIAQQLRGAHFVSHTLWTLWLCWSVAWIIDAVGRRPGRVPAQA